MRPPDICGPLVHMSVKKAASWAASASVWWVWQLVEGVISLLTAVRSGQPGQCKDKAGPK